MLYIFFSDLVERLKHRGKFGAKNSKYIRKEDAYSLKYIIVSNACSFMVGIGLASIGYVFCVASIGYICSCHCLYCVCI